MQVDEVGLRDFLIGSGALSRRQLSDLGEGNESFSAMLLSHGLLTKDELRRAVANVAGVPFVELMHDDIAEDALLYIPEPIARTHNIVGFRASRGNLEVALLDLEDLAAIDFLGAQRDVRILPRLTTGESIKRALISYHKYLKEKFGEKMKSSSNAEAATDALLSHAILHRASSVHISARELLSGQDELLVRYRIAGKMFDAMTLPRDAAVIAHQLKKLANISFTLPAPQEGSFKAVLNGEEEPARPNDLGHSGGVQVRVSTSPSQKGERVVLHLAPQGGALARKGFTLESLGFHGESLERMHFVFQKKSGLIVVEGGEGSGKTTLLYTMLDMLSAPHLSLATIEERVEYQLPHVAQMQMREEIGLTTDSGLRALLKQDPDIVMIDSIRDSKTATLAMGAAKRGVLVLAGTIGVDVADAVAHVRTQVVGKVCQKCKEVYRLSRIEAEPFESAGANFGKVLAALKEEGVILNEAQWKDLTFPHAVGCSECEEGYTGEIGLQEVRVGDEISGLTLAEDALFKAAQGITSIEEVARALEA